MAKLSSFRDLRVYQELRKLHLEVHGLSMGFPAFEKYELGTQVREHEAVYGGRSEADWEEIAALTERITNEFW